jgi:histidinol-phosphatase (PHP family)
MWSNFHTHSDYCDGKGTLEDYLRSAQRSGMSAIGFSSHAPVPFACKWCMRKEHFSRYVAGIDSLTSAYSGVDIFKGLEIDFIPDIISPADFRSRLDFTIGSVHFVDGVEGKHWEIDNTLEVFKDGLQKIFNNNIRAAVTRYLELTREMVRHHPPDIVGHLDKIKIQNTPDRWFEESENWYRDEMDKTLKVVRDRNIIVEVNTRGLYKKKTPDTYPSPWILERICELKIPIMLNSDAHHPDDLIREFEPTAALLKDIGFKNLSILKEGNWKQLPFHSYGFDR